MHSTTTPPALSVRSLASRWGCSEGVVRKVIATGGLHAFRVGTLIRIPLSEVERYEAGG